MKKIDFIYYRVSERDSLHDKLHVHDDFYEILQVVEGEGFFVIGAKTYPLQPGAVYLTNAVHLHCSSSKETSPYVRSKLAIDFAYLNRILEALELHELSANLFGENGGSFIPLPPRLAETVDHNIKLMTEYYHKNTSDASARMILLLVDILLTCNSAKPVVKEENTLGNSMISRAINYINFNISSELTIDVIARDIFVSKYYLCREFKKALGISIMKYVLSQRIVIAKDMLASTDNRCSDIAMMTGFSSFSYFSRTFRQQEGVSPSQYRLLHKKQPKAQPQ